MEKEETTKYLCERCCVMLLSSTEVLSSGSEPEKIWTDMQDILHEAEKACQSCVMLYNEICRRAHNDNYDTGEFDQYTSNVIIDGQGLNWAVPQELQEGYLEIEFPNIERPRWQDTRIRMEVVSPKLRVHDLEYSHEESVALLNAARDSESLFRWATTSLNKCCGQNANRGQSPLPSRVLQIIPVKGSDEQQVKLLITNRQMQAAYAALSYCWGGPQSMQLTIANIHDYIGGIDKEQLPQTLKDAIRVAHALGLEYLWVDAYCIMQDCNHDKTREIGQMAQIYRNAIITIAASGASTADAGFLHLNTPAPLWELDIRSLQRTTAPNLLFQYRDCVARWEQNNVLSTRAWTLQEHILSPRVLCFPGRSYQAIFECSHGIDSERGWIMDDDDVEIMGLGTNKFHRIHNVITSGEVVDKHQIWDLWAQIVIDYSRRFATEFADKLPALAALASYFKEILDLDGEYCAGLWEVLLPEALTWRTGAEDARHEPRYYAPSWSWASVSGPVWPTDLVLDVVFLDMIDYECRLLRPELPYGGLIRAALTIQGRLLTLPLETCLDRAKISVVDAAVIYQADLTFDDTADVMENTEVKSHESAKLRQVYLLPVGACGNGNQEMVGIILRHAAVTPSLPAEEYQRIGDFDLKYNAEHEAAVLAMFKKTTLVLI